MREEGAHPNEGFSHSYTGMADTSYDVAEPKGQQERHLEKTKSLPTATQRRDSVNISATRERQ